jgi:hypothetical protein
MAPEGTPIDIFLRLKDQALAPFGASIGKMQSLLGVLGVSFGALGAASFLKDSISQAAEAEKAIAKLNAVVKATGQAAGLSGKDLMAMGKEFRDSTLFTGSDLRQAETVLLTFRDIRGATFKEALGAATDMSAVLGQDLQTSALQLGKALQDPVKGITALRRAGVSFSEDQRKVITGLVETGQKAKALELIIQELNREFGGAARAEAAGYAGALKGVADAWGDLKKAVGENVVTNEAVIGSLHGITSTIESLTAALKENKSNWHDLRSAMSFEVGSGAKVALALMAGPMLGVKLGPVAGLKAMWDIATMRTEVPSLNTPAEEIGRQRANVVRALSAGGGVDGTGRGERPPLDDGRGTLFWEAKGSDRSTTGLNPVGDLQAILRVKGILARSAPGPGAPGGVNDVAAIAYWDAQAEAFDHIEGAASDAAMAVGAYWDAMNAAQDSRGVAGGANAFAVGAYWDEKAAQQDLDDATAFFSDIDSLMKEHQAAVETMQRFDHDRIAGDAEAWKQENAWRTGSAKAFDDYAAKARDSFTQVKDLGSTMFYGLENSLVSFVVTGKANFRDFADAVIADLARIVLRQQALGPLAQAVGDYFRPVRGSGAPAGEEQMIITHDAPRTASRTAFAGGPAPIVNVINNTGAPVETQTRTGPSGEQVTDVIIGTVAHDVARGGQVAQALEYYYGASRRAGA